MSLKKLELHYDLFKILADDNLTQRQMAEELGISLGKFNTTLQELVKKGFVAIERYTNEDNRAAYLYHLTPDGLEEKQKLAAGVLAQKNAEFSAIQQQIKKLQQEVAANNESAA